jgi:hypothetical protein
MNEINGLSGFGRLTMKEGTKEGWDDESEKCKEDRAIEREREGGEREK